jgi:hypothetical protein
LDLLGTIRKDWKLANGKNRRPLLISEDEISAIEEFRWKNRVPSFAEAVRRLIAKGLATENKAEVVGATPAE